MPTKTYLPPHPILFVMDFANKDAEIPAYDPASLVSSNDSCVSVRTIADVDGEVTVLLIQSLPEEDAQSAVEVFTGKVLTPSGSIALVTSENEKLIERAVAGKEAVVRVLVDDEANPG